MTVTVGRIPYLSYEPFYFDMPRRGIRLIDLAPSAVAEAVEQGQIDAGPAALVDCFRLEGQYRLLSGFCLATIRKAGSVLLHAKQPMEALNGARIGITGDAATSFRLLQILLTLKYRVQPAAYVSLEEPYDACLLIGNQGLRHRFGMPEYPHTYDLGEEWHAWTGLPFVFSHWLVRIDLEPNAIVGLEDALYVGLQDWADGLFHLAKSRDDLLMHARDILEYTQGIRYFSGRPEQQAMERFRHYLNQIEMPESLRTPETRP